MKIDPIGRRRQFLFGAGAVSVAAAATLVVTKPPAAVRPGTRPGKAEAGSGYQLTEHVRNYYRTTAV